MNFNWFDTGLLWFLLVLDIASTFYALRLRGIHEGMPLSRVLIDVGKPLYVAVRVVATGFAAYSAVFVAARYGYGPLWGAVAWQAFAVASNAVNIWRLTHA